MVLFLAAINSLGAENAPPAKSDSAPASATCYLFSYFRDNGQDGLHLAWSEDGYKWMALNGDKSFLKPEVGKDKLMRDPFLMQGPDGVFHLVWTSGWRDKIIGYANSKDLIHWSAQKAIPVMEHEAKARNSWAPEMYNDESKKQFLIFWSTTIPGRFPEGDQSGESNTNHRLYYTATKDFQTFTPTQLFFDPGFNMIDATIAQIGGKYYMIFKDERKTPVKKNLRIAVSDSPEGPWDAVSEPFTKSWVEGPSALKIGNEIFVYFDCYRDGHYGAMKSRDLKTWEDVTARLAMPKGVRHGAGLRISREIVDRLAR
ncbi:MAG: glycoside hydrolase family 43 protein [Candidatus Sumerlaeota bacterium]|nr:glycoside hydrolase family 43 protein [Candidatus Sumerlaeota bacterium]